MKLTKGHLWNETQFKHTKGSLYEIIPSISICKNLFLEACQLSLSVFMLSVFMSVWNQYINYYFLQQGFHLTTHFFENHEFSLKQWTVLLYLYFYKYTFLSVMSVKTTIFLKLWNFEEESEKRVIIGESLETCMNTFLVHLTEIKSY